VGFADFDVDVEPSKPVSPLQAGGTLRSTEALWIERLGGKPLAKARQSLDLYLRYKKGWFRAEISGHGEFDLPYLLFPGDFDTQTRQTYAWQLVPREAYMAFSAGKFELTAGRQRVAWGEGMLLSVLDVVMARDLREPGLTDLKDLRLPVTALRLGWFPGAHRFEAMAVLESDWGYRSTPQGPYGPLDGLLADSDPLVTGALEGREFAWEHEGQRFDPVRPQGFLRWRYSGSGYDLGLYAASVLDKNGTIGFPSLSALAEPGPIGLPIGHFRYGMLGHSGVATVGPILVRWELGLDLNRPISTGDLTVLIPQIGVGRTDVLNGMIGAQYGGIPHLSVDVELAGGWEPEPLAEVLFPVAPMTGAFRLAYTAAKERLVLSGAGVGFGSDLRYGGFTRVDASYEIADGVHGMVGGIVFRPGSELGPLLGLDKHDQVFVQGRWDF